jgi:hypothetical protein
MWRRLLEAVSMVVTVVVAFGLAWWFTDNPDEAQVASSVAVGVAVVLVTLLYTRHTRDMVEEMRTENRRADRTARALRVGAVENLATELEELATFIDANLRANPDGSGTKEPYPKLHLLTLEAYIAVAAALPTSCTSAVLRSHYQLEAANVRSTTSGYWKRANPLLASTIPAAIEQLRSTATLAAAAGESAEDQVGAALPTAAR